MNRGALEIPKIKVCGLTRAEDVRAAAESGADGLGFVHHEPSPRHMERDQLVELIRRAPSGPHTVLVLVDSRPDDTHELCRAVGVTMVQLCGSQRSDDWRGFPIPILRRIPVDASGRDELERWTGVATGFVLDTPSGPGGSGRLVPVDLAADLAREAPCLLAGGLGPENVASRIEQVRPFGVDASSRLEASPGSKDPSLIQQFVHAARRAFLPTA